MTRAVLHGHDEDSPFGLFMSTTDFAREVFMRSSIFTATLTLHLTLALTLKTHSALISGTHRPNVSLAARRVAGGEQKRRRGFT